MKKLRIGFLGTGYIASIHAKSLAKLDNIQIVALCNHNIEKAESFNEKHADGKAACYSDFAKMLDEQEIDALYIAIPPGCHNGEAELAASKGIHLMLEKPITLSLQRAQSIFDAVTKAKVKSQIGHHMRHTAPSIKLKQMLEDGSAGRPLMLQGRFFTNNLFPVWWRDPNLGGGQLIEQAIHIYDIARYFLGEPKTIFGFNDNLNHKHYADYQVDDVSTSTIQFQNGAVAGICAANCADPQAGSIGFSVMCQNVYVEFHGIDHATFTYHEGKPGEEIKGDVKREEVRSEHNCYDELNRNFVAGIMDDEPMRSSIVDGLESLRLVLASATSNTTGQPQSL